MKSSRKSWFVSPLPASIPSLKQTFISFQSNEPFFVLPTSISDYLRNGDRYAGEYFKDKIHGFGVYHFANGHCYEGAWHEGRRQGIGSYTFQNSDRRCGEWDAGNLKQSLPPLSDAVLRAIQAARKTAENAINLKRVDDQVNKAVIAASKAATAAIVPLSLTIIWIYASFLTAGGAYNYKGCNPNIPSSNILLDVCRKHVYTMHHCRTDVSNALSTAAWVGTYHSTSLQVSSRPPTPGVVSRGIALEGFCSILAGLWGSGTGATTLTENMHTIDITKVASRKVLVCIISVVGDTKLITKVLIPELQPNLKELVLDEASLTILCI